MKFKSVILLFSLMASPCVFADYIAPPAPPQINLVNTGVENCGVSSVHAIHDLHAFLSQPWNQYPDSHAANKAESDFYSNHYLSYIESLMLIYSGKQTIYCAPGSSICSVTYSNLSCAMLDPKQYSASVNAVFAAQISDELTRYKAAKFVNGAPAPGYTMDYGHTDHQTMTCTYPASGTPKDATDCSFSS